MAGAEQSEGCPSLIDVVRERYGQNFASSMLHMWKEMALPQASRRKLEHFLRRGEESPQALPFVVHKEDNEEHLVEFLCKLVLYAPQEWCEVVSDLPCPDVLKNDFKNIGVAFDASSRLRRAGVDYYHWRQTRRMTAAGAPGARLEGFPEVGYVLYAGRGPEEGKVYKLDELPRPPEGTVRLVAVSDTHLFHDSLRLPEGDYLLHAGDLSYEESRSPDGEAFEAYRAAGRPLAGPEFNDWLGGSGLDLAQALRWLGSVPGFKHRLLVGGNHDYILEQLGPESAERLCKEAYGVDYLHSARQPLALPPLTFWGSGVSVCASLSASRSVLSGNVAFQLADEEAAAFVAELQGRLPAGAADVVLTHSPPQGCLLGKASQGAEAIGRLVRQARPALYVCGHSHHPDDPLKDCQADLDGTLAVNAACLGVWNHLHGLPVVSDLPVPSGSVDPAKRKPDDMPEALAASAPVVSDPQANAAAKRDDVPAASADSTPVASDTKADAAAGRPAEALKGRQGGRQRRASAACAML